MKIAILSDIHGNLEALKSVLKSVDKLNITQLWVLGDTLGHYYEAAESYKLLENYKTLHIKGNHEYIFLDYLKGEKQQETDKKYGLCYQFYKKTFSKELITKIKQLDKIKIITHQKTKIKLVHEAPKVGGYVYPTEKKLTLQALEDDFDFVFMGHTHYPMVYFGSKTTIINVGSVGQNRVIGGIASWGVFNLENQVFQQMSTVYNQQKTKENLVKHQETKEYLYQVLNRNNENK